MTTTAAAPRTTPRTSSPLGKALVRWGLEHAVPRTVMTLLSRRGDLHGRIFLTSDDAEMFTLFEELRGAGEVYAGKASFATVSHPVVKQVLGDPAFRVGFDRTSLPGPAARIAEWSQEGAPIGPLTPPSLLAVEAPQHTRYRRLVTRVFSASAVRQLRERAVEVADELLDSLEGRDQVDLVEHYCARLPVTMIADILGVPPEDRDRVLAFGEGAAPSLDLGLSWSRFREVDTSLTAFEAWLADHLRGLRAAPGDDLLSRLVLARDDDGKGLDDAELLATAGLVLAAGFETTVNLLGNGIRLLLDHPDQLAGLRGADTAAWTNAVDEVLRFDPPVLLTGRTAQTTTRLGSVEVPAGALVTTLLAGANRDPAVFDAPHRFDVTRPNAGDHLSFSGGRHYCLGAALARMEGEVGLSRLFARFPQMALLPGARRRDTRILRGYARLPVAPGPAAGA